MELPPGLIEEGLNEEERAARIGRFLILQELNLFGPKRNLRIAQGFYEDCFIRAVRKGFHDVYGDSTGCDAADIELAGLYLDVFDDVWDVTSDKQGYLADKA